MFKRDLYCSGSGCKRSEAVHSDDMNEFKTALGLCMCTLSAMETTLASVPPLHVVATGNGTFTFSCRISRHVRMQCAIYFGKTASDEFDFVGVGCTNGG